MRDRFVECALVLATCLPAIALAQPQPAAQAPREGSFELSVGVGGLYLDHQLGLLIQKGLALQGADTSVAKIFPAGLAQLAYHLSRNWSLSAGSGVAFGSSALVLQPFGALSWTPDIDAGTSPFVTLGAGVTQVTWKGYRATARYGAHLGVGLRQALGDRLALRVDALVQLESFSDSAAPKLVNNAIASVGLSWFLGGRAARVAAVAVRPASTTLDALGAERQLSAAPLDGRGRALGQRAVTWTSSDSSVVAVSTSGMVTATGAGSATITAASEGATGTATVVVAPAVLTLAVTPASATLTAIGQTQQLTVDARDGGGHAIAHPVLTWSSSNSEVAIVSGSGVVTATGNGTATITAEASGKTAVTSVTVAPAPASVAVTPAAATLPAIGGTIQLVAQALDASGLPLAGTPLSWTSDAPAVATVSPTGLVTAVAYGTARITAAYQGLRGLSILTVAVPSVPGRRAAAARGAAGLPAAVNATVVLRGVNFRPNSSRLPPEAGPELDSLAAAMRRAPGARWEIGGYTSAMGATAKNLRLSRLRALAVVRYLVRHGVAAIRLRAVGYGAANPIASNATVAGRRQNMRVELRRLR